MDEVIQETSKSGYIALMLLLPAIAVVNSILHGSQLKAFLERTPAIATYQNIIDFERVVARQMYGALLQILLLVGPGVVFVVGLVRGPLAVDDVIYVMLPSFVILALGIAFKNLENRAKSIPVDDPVLADRHAHIIKVWNSKPFPDW